MYIFILEFFLLTCILFLYIYISERKINKIYRIIAGLIMGCTILMIVCTTYCHLSRCGDGHGGKCGPYGYYQKCGHGGHMMMMCADGDHDCDKEKCDKTKCKKGKAGCKGKKGKHKCIKKKIIVEIDDDENSSSDDMEEKEVEVEDTATVE